MRQKLAIVRTLVHDPKVIFLDEPTSGLDPESARTVRDAVAELAAEGRTIVLCSHNLAEVERLCTRVAVIKGRLLAMAPLSELRRAGQALDVRVEGDAGALRSGAGRAALRSQRAARGRAAAGDAARSEDAGAGRGGVPGGRGRAGAQRGARAAGRSKRCTWS